MTLRTFYAYPRETPRERETPEYADGPDTIRYGYTIDDLHRIVRSAVIADRSRAMDQHTAWDIAWEGVVTALLEADEPPYRDQLIRAGWQAIYAEIRQGNRMRGIPEDDRSYGPDARPRFAQYWGAMVQHSHETSIVERLALEQVLPVLTDMQRQAVATLAAAGDYQVGADALGINYEAFGARVRYARERFLACWYEHETPPKLRRVDRRIGSRAKPLATHCPSGHEWTPENTRYQVRTVKGTVRRTRRCSACQRDRDAKRRAAKTTQPALEAT